MADYKNKLLNAFANENSSMPFNQMTAIELVQGDVLYQIGAPLDWIYFPTDGVASVLMMMSDGSSIEVGMIGFEGLVAAQALFAEDVSQQHIIVQLPGYAYKIRASVLRHAFENDPVVRKTILRFVDAFMNLTTQTAACNRLHSVEQRCARWLLMSSDRTQLDVLPLTQEYLSTMIGVRRSGVTEVAGELQRAGLISYSPGKIKLIDREGLIRTACECYRADRERFDQLVLPKV